MKKLKALLAILIVACASAHAQDLQTPFEAKGENYTATHAEIIAFYKSLEAASPKVKIFEYAEGTDVGRPLHLVVISGSKVFHPVPLRQADVRLVMINNGIHPGEPDGVEASMMLARDLVTDPAYGPLLEHITLLIIPTYNVDGTLERNSLYRVNQNGPEEYGFRGNGRHLDLNRDFIKADSRNARTFAKIYTEWRPDVFIDTHTSNGADYPYVMTYIATHPDKFDQGLAGYMATTLTPEVSKGMAEHDMEMCPYVQTKGWDVTPDSGIVGFLETPRYSTGYAALFNAIGYTTEAHMLKPFAARVKATHRFCMEVLKVLNRDRKIVSRLRKEADERLKKQESFTIRWKLDAKPSGTLNFKGYTARYEPSAVTGFKRLRYDRDAPWQREIPFYNRYLPEVTVTKPAAYILPQAWGEAIDRLKWSGVEMKQMATDQEVEVAAYYITDCKPAPSPYEGHHPNHDVKVRKETTKITYHAGDYVIFTDQVANRYIVETLEPQAHDSYFHWNFFDEILSQKEYFSTYLFEATAAKLLQDNPSLKAEFDKKRAEDSEFSQNDYAQLDWVYKHSPHYEPYHLRYPVARMEKAQKLELRK